MTWDASAENVTSHNDLCPEKIFTAGAPTVKNEHVGVTPKIAVKANWFVYCSAHKRTVTKICRF